MIRRLLPLVGAVVLLVLTGCMTTRNEPFVPVDELARSGQYEQAAQMLSGEDRDTFYNERDKVLYYLDVGMLYHYADRYDESTRHLTEAEFLIEEYFTKSISQAASSLLINDTTQDYAGEDYEDIYLNVFKALNFLKDDDFDGAFVEVRRINNKLNLLEDKYRGMAAGYNSADESQMQFEPGDTNFHNSALARYLSMIMYRAEGDYDSARIDFRKTSKRLFGNSPAYTISNSPISPTRSIPPSDRVWWWWPSRVSRRPNAPIPCG